MDRLALVLALLLAGSAALAQPFPAEIAPPEITLYERAAKAEREGDIGQAMKLYVRAARGGDGKAAYRVGEIYEKRLGDYQEAVKWYNAARALGYGPPLIGDFPNHPKPR